ncbi:MAG: hypothetical protein R3330_15465, partial [Saprospiraceae bacterium]|nr:hypothetical protein [Saprospiraceae bacterium]
MGIRVTAELPVVNGEHVDCSAPEAEGVALQTFPIWIAASNYALSKWIIFRHRHPFYRGCTYTIRFMPTRYNSDGQCLAETQEFQFTVAPEHGSKFQRETKNVRYDLDTGQVLSFEMKEGVQVTVDEMWLRYRDELGKRDSRDEMELLDGYPKSSPGQTGVQYSRFQQEYRRVPVIGGGFLVHEQDGYIKSAAGRFIPRLNLEVEPVVTPAAAWTDMISVVEDDHKDAEYAWETVPEQFSEPEPQLVIVSQRDATGENHWRLVWRYYVLTTKPFDQFIVDVDAVDDSRPGRKVSNSFPQTSGSEISHRVISLPQGGLKSSCTLLTRYDGPQSLTDTDIACTRYPEFPGTTQTPELWLLYNEGPPSISVQRRDTEVDMAGYIWDFDSNGIFDGCATGDTQPCNLSDDVVRNEEIDGGSVYWALTQVL